VIKLSTILKEVREGAKVTFDPEKKPKSGEKREPSSIEIAYKHLDGEQLNSEDGVTGKGRYEVLYSLASDPRAKDVKAAQDALKHFPQYIKPDELTTLLKSTLVNRIPKIDYIGFLESTGGLNNLLSDTLQKLYPNAEVVPIGKMRYMDMNKAVDWSSLETQSEAVKEAVFKYIKKMHEKPGPYVVSKSDKTQSLVIRHLYSKYNIGLHPSGEGEKFPPIYDAVVKCILEKKTMLIVDDNIHTGTDFKKIFQGIDFIEDQVIDKTTKPPSSYEIAKQELEAIKNLPKFKKSKFLQDKAAEKAKEVQMYLTTSMASKTALGLVTDRIFGYTLYKLTGKDIRG
jgi:hypothetical protein